jgi:hypothetical protein
MHALIFSITTTLRENQEKTVAGFQKKARLPPSFNSEKSDNSPMLKTEPG